MKYALLVVHNENNNIMVWDTRMQIRGAVAIPSSKPIVDEQVMRKSVERYMASDQIFTIAGMIPAKQGRRLYVILVTKKISFFSRLFGRHTAPSIPVPMFAL